VSSMLSPLLMYMLRMSISQGTPCIVVKQKLVSWNAPAPVSHHTVWQALLVPWPMCPCDMQFYIVYCLFCGSCSGLSHPNHFIL